MEKQAHIQLDSSIGATKAIVVGDPARVEKFRAFLTDVQDLVFNREYKSILGTYNGEKVLIMSTGMGAPSAAIGCEELHNIGIRRVIRVGSAGASDPSIKLGELVIATGVVRSDGLSGNYVPKEFPAVPAPRLVAAAMQIVPDAHFGIIRSHDGFYTDTYDAEQEIWSKKGVIAEDMESSIIVVLGQYRGFEALSILNNVVEFQADLQDGINNLVNEAAVVEAGELKSIETALKIITN
jgi:uridine phosphorylase